jgi:hypothetical protein
MLTEDFDAANGPTVYGPYSEASSAHGVNAV